MQNIVPFFKNEATTHRYAVYLYYSYEKQTTDLKKARQSQLRWKKAYETCNAERAISHAKTLFADPQYERIEIKKQSFYHDTNAREESTFRIYQRNEGMNVNDLIRDLRDKIANRSKK